MPGQLPKDPALRQRRNRVATSATLSVETGLRHHAPALPKLGVDAEGREREWHALTRAWWRDVWHSPMASEYLQVDKHGLFRMAALVNKFWDEPSKELAAEIRLQGQCFGLTPIDRRRLQWEVAKVEEVTKQKRRVEQPDIESSEDSRKVLRVLRA